VASQSDLTLSVHADKHVTTLDTDVNVIQGDGGLDVKVCVISVLVRIDLAVLIRKLIA
jgi:hypothetical protein